MKSRGRTSYISEIMRTQHVNNSGISEDLLKQNKIDSRHSGKSLNRYFPNNVEEGETVLPEKHLLTRAKFYVDVKKTDERSDYRKKKHSCCRSCNSSPASKKGHSKPSKCEEYFMLPVKYQILNIKNPICPSFNIQNMNVSNLY